MNAIEKILTKLYVHFDTSTDQLPYTETLRSLTSSLNTKQPITWSEGAVWHKLVNMRKAGRLPKIRRKRVK